MVSRSIVSVWAALFILWGSSQVRADPKEAKALFEEGVRNAKAQRWSEALEAFERSSELVPRASTTFNIGTTLLRLSRYVEAVTQFEKYLEQGASEQLRPRAESLLSQARASVVHLRIKLEPAEAKLWVDGRECPTKGGECSLVLDPGDVVVKGAAQGFLSLEKTLKISPGERLFEQVTLGRALPKVEAPKAEKSPPLTVKTGEDESSIVEKPWFWVVTAVVVIGAGVALGVALYPRDQTPESGSSGVVVEALRQR